MRKLAQILFLIARNAIRLFNENWRQAEAWIMLFVEAVDVNAHDQGALRRVTQCSRIEPNSIWEADTVPLS